MALPSRDPSHFAYIDALRGYAFLLVLLVHCSTTCAPFPGSITAEGGSFGVQLFFLASAITLCNSMSSRHEGQNAFRNFYLRRLFRIAPLFWCAMLMYAFVPGIIPQSWAGGTRIDEAWGVYFLLVACFVQGWHPYTFNAIVPGGWSIAVEMSFYVVFPLCFCWITTIRKAALWVLAGLIFTTIEVGLFPSIAARIWPGANDILALDFFSTRWFPSQFAVFLIGIFLYFLLKEPATRKLCESRFAACSLFALGLLFLLSLLRGGLSGFLPIHLLVVMALGLVVIALAGNKVPFAVNPWICHVGTLSYSCYITHFAAMALVQRILAVLLLHEDFFHVSLAGLTFNTGHGATNFLIYVGECVATLILTVIFSTITLHLIENPGIALGKSLLRKINGPRASSAPA